jgi:hypothetical protein
VRKTIALLVGMGVISPVAMAEPSKVGLCKGAIATIMYKDPAIIEGRMNGDEAFVHYTRPADGSRWDMKCKFPKPGLVIWAGKIDGQWGRWRDKTADSIVTYTINGNSAAFKENMGGAVIGSKTFSDAQLK